MDSFVKAAENFLLVAHTTFPIHKIPCTTASTVLAKTLTDNNILSNTILTDF